MIKERFIPIVLICPYAKFTKDPKEITTKRIRSIDNIEYVFASDRQTLIPFEAIERPGMSEGDVFHSQYGLVAIHSHNMYDDKEH